MQLEDGGVAGTAGSHWEMRVMLTEFMTGVPSGLRNVKSALTLALLQDSGWYVANFDAAETLQVGSRVELSVQI